MKRFPMQLALATISLLAVSLPGFAGQLDDHYLSRFSEPAGSILQRAVLFQSPETVEAERCGTPLKHSLRRDWNQLEPATRKVLAKQLAAPVLSGAEATPFVSGSGHFAIHYTTIGSDAPPLADTTNANGIPDWVETVAATFEQVYAAYVAQGYRPAPTAGGAPYDVYLRNLASLKLYGQTTAPTDFAAPSSGFPNAFRSFMEIDNNFTDSIFTGATGGPYTPLQSLQITAAHEYHHAIQYGYNLFFDIWFAEATSTWFEDEQFDAVNQLYNYVPAWFSNSARSLDTATSTATGGGYGRWIFNRYLAEKYTVAVIRNAWEKLAGVSSPGNNADIPMLPVLDSVFSTSYASSLDSEFFGFAKRAYQRDWSTHTGEIGLIHAYTPVSTYSSYPVNSGTVSAPGVTLPHHSFAYYKFTPSATTATLNVFLTKTSGIRAAVFKKAGGVISEVTANSGGASYTINGFSALNAASDEVVLLLANTTDVDNHQAIFSTDGSSLPVIEPTGGSVYSSTTSSSSTSTSSGGGGGGGGCFIATAAYGSYLHPQVRVLRDFRDHYLMTNAPGRAFVALYYRLSPPVADFIAKHDALRFMVRIMLTPFVLVVAHPAGVGGVLLLAGCIVLRARRHRPAFTSLVH